MTPVEIIAQIIGIFGMLFNIFSYQQKSQRGLVLCQLIGCTLFTVNYFLLGAFAGALLNGLGVIRALIFAFKEKTHATHYGWFIGFVTAFIISYILVFTAFGKEPTPINLLIELLPVIGMSTLSLSYMLDSSKTTRRLGFISSPAWLIYNIIYFTLGGIICEVLSLCSIIIGTIRLDLKKKNDENDAE